MIAQVIGKTPGFFRPPFGVLNPKIARASKNIGLEVIGWNIRSLDTKIKSEQQIYDRVKQVKAGDIILLHDTSQRTVHVLEMLLKLLKEKQLAPVTISDLLKIKGYV